MALVCAQCTNCSGTLTVDADQHSATCPYCGSTYIVQEAINNYNITNVYNVEHASLTLDNEKIIENKLETAETQLKVLHDYRKALESFAALENEASKEYRLWHGKVMARTANLDQAMVNNNVIRNEVYLENLTQDFENAMALATSEQRKELYPKFLSLLKQCRETFCNIEKKHKQLDKSRKNVLRQISVTNSFYEFFSKIQAWIVLGSIVTSVLFGLFLWTITKSEDYPGVDNVFDIIKLFDDGWKIVAFFWIVLGSNLALILIKVLLKGLKKAREKKYTQLGNMAEEYLEKNNIYLPELSTMLDYNTLITMYQKKIARFDFYVKRYINPNYF